MELLSPVGNMNCLYAAINAGCDAVYLAGINFGARSFAGNFTNEELESAVNICHLYGVRVYITVNTLIYDLEVERFMKYIDFLVSINVDALIMQDIGMIDLVRKTYPTLEIHASTQANIHNLEGVKLCEKLGIKRVVLPRETSIELVREIKRNTNIEIEIFIQGALCMSYSGECLMSSLIGGRSGNRGTCAQSCRQPYSLEIDGKLVEKDKYLLSTKDLNTMEHLNELIDIGIDSLKIEGRMKSPQYVYFVTKLYRKIIDNYLANKKINITQEDITNLKKIFNREFTKGFLFNEDNDNFVNTFRPNHIGISIGEVINYKNGLATIKLNEELNIGDGIRIIGNPDIGTTVTKIYKEKSNIVSIPIDQVKISSTVLKTYDAVLMKNLEKELSIKRKIKINGICTLKIGEYIKLEITDKINKVQVTSDFKVEKANTSKLSMDKIREQLSKLGDTIYEFNNLDIDMDNNIFVPIIKLNELRRTAIEILNSKRCIKKVYKKEKYNIDIPNFDRVNKKSVLISSYEQYLKLKNNYDLIYIDNTDLYNKINDKKCILKLNRINEHLKDYNDKLLVSDLGSVYKYKNVDVDFSLNVFNSYAVAFLHSIGVHKITLSYELNYKQIKTLVENYVNRYKKNPNLEVIVNSYEEAMICKYNILKKYNKNEGYLIDRFNNKYKIIIKNNFMHIYNYKKRNLKDNYYNIGINYIRTNLDAD